MTSNMVTMRRVKSVKSVIEPVVLVLRVIGFISVQFKDPRNETTLGIYVIR